MFEHPPEFGCDVLMYVLGFFMIQRDSSLQMVFASLGCDDAFCLASLKHFYPAAEILFIHWFH